MLFFCLVAYPVQAEYTIAPDIAKEYVDLKAKIQKHPDNAALNFEYAVCLSYVGKIEEGRTALKKVRNLDPDFAEKALPKYLAEYHKYPTDPRTKYRLGFLYYFNDNRQQALNVLRDVANQEPVGQLNAWALGYMALIQGEQENWGEAEQLVRRALQIEPDAYGLHAALAAALKKQGKFLAATKEFIIALKRHRDFENYESTLVQ